MRRLGFAPQLLNIALATGALAGPVDDRNAGQSALEAAYAPLPQGGSAWMVEQTPPAGVGGISDHADGGGNPVSMVPLNSLSATRERPIFSVSRRPLALQAPDPPLPIDPVPAPVAAPASRDVLALDLIGTVVGGGTSLAIVRNPATRTVTRLREGQETAGWRLTLVKLRSIVFEKNGRSVVFGLPEKLDTTSNKAPPSSRARR